MTAPFWLVHEQAAWHLVWCRDTEAERWSCSESDDLADFIEEAIGKENADKWREAHASGDECGDTHHLCTGCVPC